MTSSADQPFDPYAVLGIARDATDEEIKAAYRVAAAKAHPDREGGSTERMTDVNMAYKILSDPAMKSEYDRTGATRQGPSLEQKAQEYIIGLLKVVLRGTAPGVNIIQMLKEGIAKQQVGCRESRLKCQSELAMLRDRLRRLKGPPDNFIETVILQEIERGEAHLPTYDADEEVMVESFRILEEYSYSTDYGRYEASQGLLAPASFAVLSGPYGAG